MQLSAAQMAQMSRLLDEVIDLDSAGRLRWLERLSPDYAELLPALRQALLDGGGAGSSLDLNTLPKIGAGPGDTIIAVGGLEPGSRIGPYQLVRMLGAGGMAEVWLARRADGAYEREVALKLPMLSQLRRDLSERFAHERNILAGLEHVNIARFYDAGITPDGLPYLAMEFVPGQPITAWCDAHHLGVRERIKLFLQVLDAVQYAHARQVIHRDIKPSNILVTEAGQVRLLDFGIAKLLAADDGRAQLTHLYGRALTPAYASPEALFGDPADALSDVYSLGVVLYELLTGNMPYRHKTGSTLETLERSITDSRVQRPSGQVSPKAGTARSTTSVKLARRLRGDLDAIVLKTLAPDHQERYDSVTALADDLHRYLSGEPVEARTDSPAYQTGKFLVRHRIAVAIGVVATVALAAILRFQSDTQAPAPALEPSASIQGPAPEKSIAVLPFVNMSDDPKQEYFADGLSEELLDLLSRVADLSVAARTSAFTFKGKSDDIPTIARKLRVSNVLEGSVRKSGDKLRITVQLVHAENGYHVWSQTYDRKLEDIFKIQDDIAESVVKALKVSLLDGSSATSKGTKDPEAYNWYLRARFTSQHAGPPADYEKIVQYLQQTLQLDPTYAPAWASLSGTRSLQAAFGFIPAADGWKEARQAAKQALMLDPNLPEAHAALARIEYLHDWDWSSAQAQMHEALRLDPNSPTLAWAGYLAAALGKLDTSLGFLQRGVASDPLDPHAYAYLGVIRYRAGRLADARAAFDMALDLNAAESGVHTAIAEVMLAKGDSAAALVEAERETDVERRVWGRAIVYFAVGRKAAADAALAELEKNYAEVDAYNIAEIHATRGEIDQAFDWLDRAYRQRDYSCTWIISDPLLKNLRGDARYKAFLRKMNLPDAG